MSKTPTAPRSRATALSGPSRQYLNDIGGKSPAGVRTRRGLSSAPYARAISHHVERRRRRRLPLRRRAISRDPRSVVGERLLPLSNLPTSVWRPSSRMVCRAAGQANIFSGRTRALSRVGPRFAGVLLKLRNLSPVPRGRFGGDSRHQYGDARRSFARPAGISHLCGKPHRLV